jgi:hypothetical protein
MKKEKHCTDCTHFKILPEGYFCAHDNAFFETSVFEDGEDDDPNEFDACEDFKELK